VGFLVDEAALGQVLQFPLAIFITPNAPYSYIIRPTSGRRPNWTSAVTGNLNVEYNTDFSGKADAFKTENELEGQ
jgi:hypothetical protein